MEHITVQESEFSLLSGEDFSLPNISIVHLLHLASKELPQKEPDFSDRFAEVYEEKSEGRENEFEAWYEESKKDSLTDTTERMMKVLMMLKKEIHKIHQSDVEDYCRSQLISDSWIGEDAKEGILKKIAMEKHTLYKTDYTESSIDGYIGGKPVIIRPYQRHHDDIEDEVTQATTIFYKLNSDGVDLYFEFEKVS
jgi:hypothetical protein